MMQRFSGSAIAILILCAPMFAQQDSKPSPLSDYQYKTDYARYETIKKESDPQKREGLLLTFLKDRPISRMLSYIVADYLECIKPIIEKDLSKAIALEEGLLVLLPTEKTIQDAGIPAGAEGPASADDFRKTQLHTTQVSIQRSLLSAYYKSNNFPKALETAEKLYTPTHDPSMLPVLAEIALKMKDYDKFLDYGNKILAGSSIEKECLTAIQMAQVHTQKQNTSAAMDLYSKVVDAFGDKFPPNLQEVQYNAIRTSVYATKGNAAYEKKDYPKAQELFEKILQYDPKNGAIRTSAYLAGANAAYFDKKDYPKAQELFEKAIQVDHKNDFAHFYFAMCKWQNKDPEGAIEAFAKCVVLNKPTAKKAQEHLETLYKARNKESLEGLDKVLAKAKTDLGIK
jgi:tetratricopeptide (TPR) repeat protein